MFRFRAFITMILLTATTLTMVAQAPSVSVHANSQVVQGRNFTVTFRVTNFEGQVSRAPEIKGCTLRYGPGIRTMMSASYTPQGSQSVQITDYTFTYYADKAGTYTIPSLSISSGGNTLKTKPFKFTVLPPDKSEQQRSQHGNGGGQVVESNTISPKDLIVTVSLSKDHLYEQEAVIATIKVYTKHNIVSFRATTLPSYDGFLAEDLEVSQQQPQLEHFRGENYYSLILKKSLLYPQKSGKLTINSGRYDVTLQTYEVISNGFMYTRRPIEKNITTSSNSVFVNVNALPKPQPADFSGAVGDFKASASLEPSLLRTNEAATYTYRITGTGNIKYLTAPEIDFGSNIEEYKPESEAEANYVNGNMTGTFTAVYTIVPQQPGQFELPARDFVYFNPSTGKYVSIPLDAISSKIIKGSNTSSSAVIKSSEPTKIDDILHIKSLKDETLESEPHRTAYTWSYLLCYLAVLSALIAAAIIYRRNIKLNADVQGRRTARARRIAAKRLKLARTEMQRGDNNAFYDALSSAIWGYIGDKLGIQASALTRENIQEKLVAKNISAETIDKTISLLDECEMSRFTPEKSETHISDMYNNAVDIIDSLENPKKETASHV